MIQVDQYQKANIEFTILIILLLLVIAQIVLIVVRPSFFSTISILLASLSCFFVILNYCFTIRKETTTEEENV